MTISIWTKDIKLHWRMFGYNNHPEYAITITFGKARAARTKKFLVRELVDHILEKQEKVTVPNIPMPEWSTMGCPTKLVVSFEDNERTQDNTEALWTPEIRVCGAHASDETDFCCAAFEFNHPIHGQDTRPVAASPMYPPASGGRKRYFRRKVVGKATFETCKNHPDTTFEDPMWDPEQLETVPYNIATINGQPHAPRTS